MGADDDLVDPGHDSKDGRVCYHSRLNFRFSQRRGKIVASKKRRSLRDDYLQKIYSGQYSSLTKLTEHFYVYPKNIT